jgi:hypothetical protein
MRAGRYSWVASPEARGYTPRFVPPVGIGGATFFA